MSAVTVRYAETHWHLCPAFGHQDLVECTSGPNCTLRFKVACPACLEKLCTGRANARVTTRGYGAQL